MTPAQAVHDWVANASLEELLVSPHFFGLTTATPVQRAVCRILDGLPLGALALDETVVRLLGGDGVQAPDAEPKEVSWLAAIRCAKSFIAAALCVRLSQRVFCDPKLLRHGDFPRIPILSIEKDKAQAVFNHLSSHIVASPVLKMILFGEPKAESLILRHPTGRPVQVMVAAGKRAGSAVVAYWLAGVIFDEYPRMSGADEAVVNWDETSANARGRILEHGCILNVGSPWAPEGPAYRQVAASFGRPSASLVVMRSNGADTNPVWWTQERIAEDERTNPSHRMDCLAEFATPEEALFSSASIESAFRKQPEQLPPQPGAEYTAAMDPATRGNGWTLVVVTREGPSLRIAMAKEWIGSRDKPLDPGVVLDEAAVLLAPYGITTVDTDQVMGDALVRLARDRGLSLIQWTLQDAERTRRYLAMRTRFAMGHIELAPAEHLREDLIRLRRIVTRTGVHIDLPLTSDGRHCDYAPALMLALSKYLDDVKPAARVEDPEVTAMREAALRRYGGRNDDAYDD